MRQLTFADMMRRAAAAEKEKAAAASSEHSMLVDPDDNLDFVCGPSDFVCGSSSVVHETQTSGSPLPPQMQETECVNEDAPVIQNILSPESAEGNNPEGDTSVNAPQTQPQTNPASQQESHAKDKECVTTTMYKYDFATVGKESYSLAIAAAINVMHAGQGSGDSVRMRRWWGKCGQ